MTRLHPQKLLNDGNITEREYNGIFLAAQAYFKAAISYILKTFLKRVFLAEI
jgi:hypothetical protein